MHLCTHHNHTITQSHNQTNNGNLSHQFLITLTFLAVAGNQRFLGNRSNIGLGFVIHLIRVTLVTSAVVHG